MPSAEFIRRQDDEINALFDFAPDEGEARSKFRRLALDTYDYFAPSVGFMWPISPVPQFAQSDIDHWTGLHVPMPHDLQERWQAWRAEWPGLLERNPKLELYLAIKTLAYSFLQNSWMEGLEGRLQDWVDSGERLPIPLGPLQDEQGIVTPEFFERLCELRKKCAGWFYRDRGGTRFVPEPFCTQMSMAQKVSYAEFVKVWNDFAEILDREQPLYR